MNYLYNGIPMPEIPKTLPYAVIGYVDLSDTIASLPAGSWYATLILSSAMGTTDNEDSNNLYFPDGTTIVRHFATNSSAFQEGFSSPCGLNAWGEGEAVEDSTHIVLPMHWASYDVLRADGTVYLAATAPVALMTITHKLRIDLQQKGVRQRIDVAQGDTNSRVVQIALYSGGVPYRVPDDTVVALSYARADKAGGLYDTLHDGSAAGSVYDNVVTVKLVPEVTAKDGIVRARVELMRETMGESLGLFGFDIVVDPDPAVDVAEASGDYINWFGAHLSPTTVTTVKDGSTVTVTAEYENGTEGISVIALSDDGDPVSVTNNGAICNLIWEGFDE